MIKYEAVEKLEVQMNDEVAVFIDLENLRYGLLNNFGQEPDFRALVEKAKKYGRPSVMRAYADFTEHPQPLSRELQVAGIEAINVPVKRSASTLSGKPVERVKNAADMVLALDAMVEALDADSANKQKVFLLVSGDRDYVKLVTLLRNRFGQKVVVAGVPGSTAPDLVSAAGGQEDAVEVPHHVPADKRELREAIVAMVRRGPAPLSYWTRKTVDQWAQDGRQRIPGTAKERRDAIHELVAENVLVVESFEDLKRGRVNKASLDESRAQELGYLVSENKIAPR